MADPPVENTHTLLHFTGGAVAFAGHWVHEDVHPVHTHSFVEVAVTMSGDGVHHCLAGRQRLVTGDVLLLRPGVWHGYEDCHRLDVYNCCFSAELLRHELAWMREDPLLGHLLWTSPYSAQRRGVLSAHLDEAALAECVGHLDALDELRSRPLNRHRGDIIGRLALFLSCLARAVVAEQDDLAEQYRTHPAVVEAVRMMEDRPEYPWTLTDLADQLHLAPGYLVRLFKSATGLPPMAFLARHRVETAAARLLGSDEPISRIGESVGWPDQNYFARRFRAHYGMSASAYRGQFTRRAVRMGLSSVAAAAR